MKKIYSRKQIPLPEAKPAQSPIADRGADKAYPVNKLSLHHLDDKQKMARLGLAKVKEDTDASC